jgi:hypothetical protein
MSHDDGCCKYEAAKWVLTAENPSANIVFFEVLRQPGLSAYAAIHRIHNESDYEVLVETHQGASIKLLPQNSIDVSSFSVTLRIATTVRENTRVTGTYKLLCCTLAGETELELNLIARVLGDAGQPLTVKMLP